MAYYSLSNHQTPLQHIDLCNQSKLQPLKLTIIAIIINKQYKFHLDITIFLLHFFSKKMLKKEVELREDKVVASFFFLNY